MRKLVFGSAVGCVSLIALMSCTTAGAATGVGAGGAATGGTAVTGATWAAGVIGATGASGVVQDIRAISETQPTALPNTNLRMYVLPFARELFPAALLGVQPAPEGRRCKGHAGADRIVVFDPRARGVTMPLASTSVRETP